MKLRERRRGDRTGHVVAFACRFSLRDSGIVAVLQFSSHACDQT